MGAAGDFQAGRSVVHLLELVRMDPAFRTIDATPRFGDPMFAEPECMPAKAGGKQAAYRHSAKTGECEIKCADGRLRTSFGMGATLWSLWHDSPTVALGPGPFPLRKLSLFESSRAVQGKQGTVILSAARTSAASEGKRRISASHSEAFSVCISSSFSPKIPRSRSVAALRRASLGMTTLLMLPVAQLKPRPSESDL
jgi:hypothetical protein